MTLPNMAGCSCKKMFFEKSITDVPIDKKMYELSVLQQSLSTMEIVFSFTSFYNYILK